MHKPAMRIGLLSTMLWVLLGLVACDIDKGLSSPDLEAVVLALQKELNELDEFDSFARRFDKAEELAEALKLAKIAQREALMASTQEAIRLREIGRFDRELDVLRKKKFLEQVTRDPIS